MVTNSGTVFIVEDDASFRRSAERVLRLAGFEVRGFDDAEAFLAAPRDAAPCCLLLDVRMPGLSGLELQRRIAWWDDPLPIVFLTGYGEVPASVSAMKAGAVEFLTKPVEPERLVVAIETALDRDRRARVEREELRELRARHARLTARERQVLQRVADGLRNRRIAAELGISEVTVKVHRGRAMAKMGAESLPELARLYDRLGLTRPRG